MTHAAHPHSQTEVVHAFYNLRCGSIISLHASVTVGSRTDLQSGSYKCLINTKNDVEDIRKSLKDAMTVGVLLPSQQDRRALVFLSTVAIPFEKNLNSWKLDKFIIQWLMRLYTSGQK